MFVYFMGPNSILNLFFVFYFKVHQTAGFGSKRSRFANGANFLKKGWRGMKGLSTKEERPFFVAVSFDH